MFSVWIIILKGVNLHIIIYLSCEYPVMQVYPDATQDR